MSRRPLLRIRARAGILLVLAVATGCRPEEPAPPPPWPDPGGILLRLPPDPVEFGKPFPLAVLRRWPAAGPAPAWDPQVLAPLVVEPAGIRRWTVADAVLERRGFRARAFVPPGILDLPGGARLQVRSALDEADPTRPEAPPPPPAAPFPWRLLLAAVLAVAGAGVLFSWFRRRPRPAVRPAGPAPRPARPGGYDPRQRLARLAAHLPADATALDAWHGELAALLRDYLEERWGLPARRRTAEELAVAGTVLRSLGPDRRNALVTVLQACDRVRFGGDRPRRDALQALLDATGTVLDGEAIT